MNPQEHNVQLLGLIAQLRDAISRMPSEVSIMLGLGSVLGLGLVLRLELSVGS
jgi:hypothetical protein